MTSFDPTLHTFHSLEFKSVVREAIEFLNETTVYELPGPEKFIGVGVYQLYYVGEYEPYTKVAEVNEGGCRMPIYVGKAVPKGWRTARHLDSDLPRLHNRLREHERSIRRTDNLNVTDFRCRFIILRDDESNLIVPIEAQLIRKYKPLWNTTIDGFGNHDPGKGRYNQSPSEWDVLHPGRPWVEKLTGEPPNISKIRRKVRSHWDSLELS